VMAKTAYDIHIGSASIQPTGFFQFPANGNII